MPDTARADADLSPSLPFPPPSASPASAPAASAASAASANPHALDERLWAQLLGLVRRDRPDLDQPWFGQLRPLSLDRGVLRVVGPDAPRTDWLRKTAAPAFTAAAQVATGYLVFVEFLTGEQAVAAAGPGPASSPVAGGPLTDDPSSRSGTSPTAPGMGSGTSGQTGAPARPADPPATRAALSPEYTFENFILGPTNRFAHAACLAVSENPGRAYNPLFVHGSVGLGKTHLLQAVGHGMLSRDPAARVLYLSCESFINDFIDAVERNALGAFRDRLRGLDCLIIDDIQFLTEGDRTQEEFFHTFNALYQAGRQIILSADVPPEKIAGLEERLVSRFKWGLVAQIDPPDFVTRVAILKKKARLRRVELPDDVARLVAEAVGGNTRQLEGALTTLQHAGLLEGRPIDLRLARGALPALLPPEPPPAPPAANAPPAGSGLMPIPAGPPPVTIQTIIEVACREFGLKPVELTGKRRTKTVAQARMTCMYLARRLTKMSLEEIGGYFGGRDHTTVLHAERTIDADRTARPEVAESIARIAGGLGVRL
jgi:chromosomal replication initiator protein